MVGEAARRYVEHQEMLLRDAATALKIAPDELPGRLSALLEERKRLDREMGELRRKLARGGGADANGEDVREVAGPTYRTSVVEGKGECVRVAHGGRGALK